MPAEEAQVHHQRLLQSTVVATPINEALEFLCVHQESIDNWDGFCLDLADAVIQWLKKQGRQAYFIYFTPISSRRLVYMNGGWDWKYHAVVCIDGMIHDAWNPKVQSLRDYLCDNLYGSYVMAEHVINKDEKIRQFWNSPELEHEERVSLDDEMELR